MKLLFVHDHPFYKDSNKIIYTGGSFPKQIWSNYLSNFNTICVYSRKSKSISSKNGISSRANVTFYLTHHYSTPIGIIKNKKRIEEELEVLIKDVDVVLTRLPSALGIIAGFLALKLNKRLWVEQVGNAHEALNNHGTLKGKVIGPIIHFFNKKLIEKADFVSYVTESKLQIDYPTNNEAITVSLSNVIINEIINEKDLDKERFYGKMFKIGLIGGFDVRYKGQDILLRAISLLPTDIKKNIKMNFVGKGNYSWIYAVAQNLGLKENIEFLGSLEAGHEINAFLNTLSLYVQPSLTEGMPRATIEAMAMGCPVIGSNVGGIPDIVTKRFLHKKGNVQQLSEHIKYLYLYRKELEQESALSIQKSIPYLKANLDKKRADFFEKMNKKLGHEN